MSVSRALGLPDAVAARAAIAGGALGIVYALSPLTVWFGVAVGAITLCALKAVKGLDPVERRWVTRVLIVAVAVRVIAVAALFTFSDHTALPFGTLFGDEDYFIRRSLWLRNLALGVPLNGSDLVSAFQAYNASSHLYALAFIQLLVGPAPYGVHLAGILFYLMGVSLLYATVRSTLGRMPALLGLTALLFLPSLFAWSISALKEPLFVLVSAASFVLAVEFARSASWRRRAACMVGLAALAAILETIRHGGALLSAIGILSGLLIGWLATRPRFLLAALVAVPVIAAAVLSRPAAQLTAYVALENAARQHWGHVAVTPGYAYQLLDDRFYPDLDRLSDLRLGEAMRFVARAFVAYVTVPLPWNVQSRAALAYLPEQVVWYLLVLLAPIGAPFAFRRDPIVAGLLVGHAVAIAAAVALNGGNVGTLVRHRGLVLPYLVWLSAVGFCELVAAVANAHDRRPRSRAAPAMQPAL